MQNYKILLIEDNYNDIKLFKHYYGSDFNLDIIPRLEDSYTRLTSNGHDLIVADLNVEDAKGFELIIKIREKFPYIPLFILTGEYKEDDSFRAQRKLGVQGFFNKNDFYAPDGNKKLYLQLLISSIARGKYRKEISTNPLIKDEKKLNLYKWIAILSPVISALVAGIFALMTK